MVEWVQWVGWHCCVCKSERVREYVAVVVAMSKIEWFLEWVRRR